LHILDTDKEARFDRYTKLVSDIFNTPIVLITLINTNRQWFKSCIGLPMNEIPLSESFCSYTILEKEILVISDITQDQRFAKYALVLNEPKIRFYAGAILKGATDQALGTLCIMDKKPRQFSHREQQQLIQFAHLVEHEMKFNYHLNEMRNKIEKTLYYDELTGLPNLRLFKERLAQAIEITQYPYQIAVISLKINRLKELMDSFSYKIAEFVINETANRLKQVLGKSDIGSHWSDTYFIAFFIINPERSSLLVKLEELIKIFEKSFRFNNEEYFITCNIGISVFPSDSSDASQLVDNSMYITRSQSSRNELTYQFYSEESTKKLAKEYELETLLKRAIEEGSLEILYQPKVDILTKYICGAEALCRWNDSKLGSISPEIFIPLAEQSDLIIKLGEWALKQACMQNHQWQVQGYRKFPISVNITKKQLLKKMFKDDVQSILRETNLDPCYLDLELTESSLIKLEDALTNMNEIRKLGITFSLDDFGTGFSSLSYIQRLPLKTLKIDKTFINDIIFNKNDATIVRTIIAMSKTLNLICVAEGVETSEQLLYLRKYKCDQMQGYLYSPPLSVDAFSQLLQNDKRLDI
jgi:diguanylate cyclase (GGDEF)-like protein